MKKINYKQLSKIILDFELGKQVTLDSLNFSKNINRSSFENQIKQHLKPNQMTAMDLCGNQGNGLLFTIGYSKIEWESISYRQGCDKLRVQRLCEVKQGGTAAFLGMNLKQRYITPETIVSIIQNIN